MTLPFLGWRGGSWFLQFIYARVNKFSICGFGLYLNFEHNYKNYNCHNYKSCNYNIITFSFAFDGILFIFLFLSASFICLILYFH